MAASEPNIYLVLYKDIDKDTVSIKFIVEKNRKLITNNCLPSVSKIPKKLCLMGLAFW